MTHMMQYTMPTENVRAIFETVDGLRSGEPVGAAIRDTGE